MAEIITFSVKPRDENLVKLFKRRHKGHLSEEIVRLIRHEVLKNPGNYDKRS